MVGVPGRSKACLTCRKRKIRCGLERPTCTQCRTAKRGCGGYAKPTIFVNTSSEGLDQHSRGASNTTHLVFQEPKSLQRSISGFGVNAQNHGDSSPRLSPRLLQTISAAQDQILMQFVNSTLPADNSSKGALSWIKALLRSTNDSDAFSLAGAAISHGWIGHTGTVPDNVIRGRQCYLRSLAALRRDLAVEQRACSEKTIAAMSVLVLYELIEFGTYNATGWLAHTSGLETIASRATAHAFVAGPIHKIFLFCRTVIIVKSLVSRRATFLSRDEWQHIPWTLYPKSTFHQFLDLVAEATSLLEASDAYTNSVNPIDYETNQATYLLVRLALMISRIQQWHKELDITLPEGPPILVEDASVTVMHQQPSRAPARRHWYPSNAPPNHSVPFELMDDARLMLFYWAVELTLQTEVFRSPQLRITFHKAHEISIASQSNLSVEDSIRSAISIDRGLECADNILKWFGFATQDAWRAHGSIFAVLALQAAIAWYSVYQELPRSRASPEADRSKHRQQCREMLQDLPKPGDIGEKL